MDVEHRLGAEIADPRLDGHPSVRLDDQQAVEPDRPGGIGTETHADAAYLRSVLRTAAVLPRLPVEQLGALVERLLRERARDVLPCAACIRSAEGSLALRRVDLVHRQLIDPEL